MDLNLLWWSRFFSVAGEEEYDRKIFKSSQSLSFFLTICEFNKKYFQVQLKFNQEVKFIKKVEYYSFLQFLVDVGSSLGLWLGLSIIGLTDLGIQLADKTKGLGKSLFRRS